MVISALRPDASLAEFLAHRAREASLRRLWLDVTLGTVAAVATISSRPAGWVILTSAALCFIAYGSWGLLDRARSYPAIVSRPVLVGVCETLAVVAVLTGTLAVGAMLFAALRFPLGTWFT